MLTYWATNDYFDTIRWPTRALGYGKQKNELALLVLLNLIESILQIFLLP